MPKVTLMSHCIFSSGVILSPYSKQRFRFLDQWCFIFHNNSLLNANTLPSAESFTCLISFHLPSNYLVCISQGGLCYAVVTNNPEISVA